MHSSIRQDIELVEATTRPAKLETTPLPYAEDGLDPVLSKKKNQKRKNLYHLIFPNHLWGVS